MSVDNDRVRQLRQSLVAHYSGSVLRRLQPNDPESALSTSPTPFSTLQRSFWPRRNYRTVFPPTSLRCLQLLPRPAGLLPSECLPSLVLARLVVWRRRILRPAPWPFSTVDLRP